MLAITLLIVGALGYIWLSSRHKKRIVAAASKVPFTIEVHDDGLMVHRETATTTRMRWEDILAVRAFKLDCHGSDTIYFAVDSTLDGGGFEISEDHYQLKELVSALEAHLPGFDKEWFNRVALPPFEACETVPYLRRGMLEES